MTPSYAAPPDGWVCWHCGVRCRTPAQALEHFGPRPTSRPSCCLSVEELRALLRELRALEERVAASRGECS